MTDVIVEKPKKPGIVIFVSILHWISVVWCSVVSLVVLLALLFSTVWSGMDIYFKEQISQVAPPNSAFGPVIMLGMILGVVLCFTGFFLAMAIGLLKGKKFAWYVQIGLSVLGLLSFAGGLMGVPLTLINLVILFFFFTPRIREYFKV